MSDDRASRTAAEERVHQFMIEYAAQWRIAAPAFEQRDPGNPLAAFDRWTELMAQTRRNHFTETSTVQLAQAFGDPADYGPEAERFVRSEIDGDVAYVLTRSTSPLTYFHEYTLRSQGADWRIAAIDRHLGDPTEPFVDPATVEDYRSVCGPAVPLAELPREQARMDHARNFTTREVRSDDGEVVRAEVSAIGTLVTTSGVLSVLDFGLDNDDARPLARTVSPGSYPVDRVTAFGRNAAVRVRFSAQQPVSWHPADPPGGGHVFGVDTGCACIVDYVGYSAMTRREKAAAYQRFGTMARPSARAFRLGGEDVGVAFDSGYGDGGYPAYWGVDAAGTIAQLVVDFMVLATEDDDGVIRHR